MLNIGILSESNSVQAMLPSPALLGRYKHEVNLLFLSPDKEEDTNDRFTPYTPIYCHSFEEIYKESDILLVEDVRGYSLETNQSKIVITPIDIEHNYSYLLPYLKQKVDLYVFNQDFLKPVHHNTTVMSDLLFSFIRFYLGEPIPSHEIQLIANSKVIERGRLTSKRILNLIDQY